MSKNVCKSKSIYTLINVYTIMNELLFLTDEANVLNIKPILQNINLTCLQNQSK